MKPAPRYVRAVVDAVTAYHPYRDAIRGDLEEEYALRAAGIGAGPARMWYLKEALRTSTTILRRLRLTPAASAGVLAVVFEAYLAVLAVDRAGSYLMWRERVLLAPTVVRLAMLGWVLAAGAVAGYAVTRFVRTLPLVGILAFLALALGIGIHYVDAAAPHEVWIRAAKVAVLTVAAAGGAWRGIARSGVA